MLSRLFPERMPSTWRLGLLLAVLLACSTALCIFVAGLAIRQNLDAIARAVVLDDLGEYAVFYHRSGLREIESVFAAGSHEQDQAIRITDARGQLLFEQIPPAVTGYQWPDRPPVELATGETHLTHIPHKQKNQELLAGCQMLADGNVLWFGRTDADDRLNVERIRGRLWLAGCASMAFMLLPLWWFVRHVLRPVQTMMLGASQLAEGSTAGHLVAPDAVPELKAFARAFNTGLDRIADLTTELQSANDNLAHELRTPLARVRGNLEAFHDLTENASARDAAARGLEEIDRAADLVQTILAIRAGEHHALKLHLEPVNVRKLLEQLFELYQPAAEQRGVRLSLLPGDAASLQADRQRVTQAAANLLDNALAYTSSPGEVEMRLDITDTCARIIVADTGPGLKPDEVERIWERYVRGSAASANTPGMGLGLSLVRAIATAHDGSWGCANRSEGGALFWIDLPIQKPRASATGDQWTI